ncbi:MAG: hypothetical protein ACLFWH_14040 [Actinomycetota bacterium]
MPETDAYTVILGAALPLALVTLPPIQARAWATGAFVLAGLYTMLVLGGGETRPWTLLAAWATIAPIPVIAAVVHLRTRRPALWIIFVTHVVYVAAITRVADYTGSVLVVVISFIALIALTVLVLWFLTRFSPDAQPSS